MDEMNISEFKAKCLSVLEDVRTSGRSLLITKRGKPMATVSAPVTPEAKRGFGCMAGTVDSSGWDIGPVDADWEATG
ncbi:MAG: type II toxin-antitoxin system Phd/YefM family antitoxin [Actinomycetota bacterium]